MRERGASPLTSGPFRIAAAALAGIVVAAATIAYMLFERSEAALTAEVMRSLETDLAIIERQAARGGTEAARDSIISRTEAVGTGLYLLSAADGRKLAGNLDTVPAEIAERPSGGVFTYRRTGGNAGATAHQAVAIRSTLPDGASLIVGRDIEREKQTLASMRWLALLGMSLLAIAGLAAGYAISRYVLKRVEEVNRTAQSIMAGDLSRRIAITGSGDEIDGLASNLNRMLDRIEQLMSGLREVSDNIAHDLKTPLNRLRNRAEAALRDGQGESACREGLERTIEEADELIKTFNALLLIARLEAGALEGTTESVDMARLVADVVELYEPVAEEAGLALELVADQGHVIEVNRHLVGQAVANLLDNAIKYGNRRPVSGQSPDREFDKDNVRVTVSRTNSGIEIGVADRGPGIGAEDRARVLKRFVRLEESRSRPGTGLGLSLVAAVARLHHGTIRLEDNAPGLRVVLKLPDAPDRGQR